MPLFFPGTVEDAMKLSIANSYENLIVPVNSALKDVPPTLVFC